MSYLITARRYLLSKSIAPEAYVTRSNCIHAESGSHALRLELPQHTIALIFYLPRAPLFPSSAILSRSVPSPRCGPALLLAGRVLY